MVADGGGIQVDPVDEKRTEIEDAGEVQALASMITRHLTRSDQVKASDGVYISPSDPDIAIPISTEDQKTIFTDKVAAAWERIRQVAAGR